MGNVRTFSMGVVLTGIAGAALIASQPVLASSYEYIKNVYLVPGSSLHSNQSVTSTFETVTTGSYYEYRTVYYSTNGPSGPWSEWTNCRHEGTLYGSEDASCAVTLPSVATTSTVYVRAATNFSGCGTWTPTPNESTCGGTMTTSYTVTP